MASARYADVLAALVHNRFDHLKTDEPSFMTTLLTGEVIGQLYCTLRSDAESILADLGTTQRYHTLDPVSFAKNSASRASPSFSPIYVPGRSGISLEQILRNEDIKDPCPHATRPIQGRRGLRREEDTPPRR